MVGHCICDLTQDSDGQGCPFCRAEIKGTEQVVVDPFDPRGHSRVTTNSNNNRNSPGNSIPDDEDDTFEVRKREVLDYLAGWLILDPVHVCVSSGSLPVADGQQSSVFSPLSSDRSGQLSWDMANLLSKGWNQ